jgi:adenylosuccinate synthase
MPLDIVVGSQWGDEGKGRVVDLLSADADYVARYNGGDNAGHTVSVGHEIFKLHLIPSGIIHTHCVGIIGNGVVVNPTTLIKEIGDLQATGITVTPERLHLSYAAHLITPAHLALDRAQEISRGTGKIGTTLRGIGPAYTSKVSRQGLRLSTLLNQETLSDVISTHLNEANKVLETLYNAEPVNFEQTIEEFRSCASILSPYIGDASVTLAEALHRGKRVLAEGAQGTLLDLDHGTYPYVTSSNPSASGALIGLGLGMGYTERVIGVTKSFQSRVGDGPFPTELVDDIAEHLRGTGEKPWDEFGTTTGRPRRVGWLDTVLLRYAVRINGITELALTKLDILTGLETIKVCTSLSKGDRIFKELPLGLTDLAQYEPIYEEIRGWDRDISNIRRWEDLPREARTYILRIEESSGVPIRLVSVGPERDQIVEIN